MTSDEGGTTACTAQAPADSDRTVVVGPLSGGVEITLPLRIPTSIIAAIVEQITTSLWASGAESCQAVLCVTLDAAAKMLSVSGRQLTRYMNEGKIEVVELGSKCKRIRVAEIQRFLKERSLKKLSPVGSTTFLRALNSTSKSTPSTRQPSGKAVLDVTAVQHLKAPAQGREVQETGRRKRRLRRRKSGLVQGKN